MPTQTREELETRLKARSESMSSRMAAIEGEVSLPSVPGLSSGMTAGRGKKIALFVGLGVVVGLVTAGVSRGMRSSGSRRTWDDDVADAVDDLIREGHDPQTAVRKALLQNPPSDGAGSDKSSDSSSGSGSGSGGTLGFLVGLAIKQITNVLVGEITNYFSGRNGGSTSR